MPISPLRSGLILTTFALSVILTSSAVEASYSYDGRWRVLAVADPGKCAARYSVAIQVANGQINSALLGAIAVGKVDQKGQLKLEIDVVRASGALAATTGFGRWSSPACSGSWTARRAASGG
jgi:hypothetical protein